MADPVAASVAIAIKKCVATQKQTKILKHVRDIVHLSKGEETSFKF